MICHDETPTIAWYTRTGNMVVQHFKGGSMRLYESYDTFEGAALAVYELNLHQHMLDVKFMVEAWVRVNSLEHDSLRLSENKRSVRRLLGWLRELASHNWMMQEVVQDLLTSKCIPKLNDLLSRHLRGQVCATNELRNLGWRDPLCRFESDLLDLELKQYEEHFA